MIYEMRDVESGELVEYECPMAQAPDFGVEIKVDGRRLVRPMPSGRSLPQARVAKNLKVVGWSAPDGLPGATAYLDPVSGKVSKEYTGGNGVPMYDNHSDLTKTAKETGGEFIHERILRKR